MEDSAYVKGINVGCWMGEERKNDTFLDEDEARNDGERERKDKTCS